MEETEYSVPNTEEYDCEYEEMVYRIPFAPTNSSPVMVNDEYENNLPTWAPAPAREGRYQNVLPVPVQNSLAVYENVVNETGI